MTEIKYILKTVSLNDTKYFKFVVRYWHINMIHMLMFSNLGKSSGKPVWKRRQ